MIDVGDLPAGFRQCAHPGALPITKCLPFVIAVTFLTSCSQIFSTTDDVPISRVDADYRKLIAANFTSSFKDHNSYSNVEISSPRPVDSIVGRTTITCLRFDAVLGAPVAPGSAAAASHTDRRRLVYVYYIRNNAIVDARYDVQTDQCAMQSYEPFSLTITSGKPGPAQSPIY